MVEPLTLTAMGTVALTEGIKFLYDQAREAIKHWRDSRSRGEERPVSMAAPDTTVLDAPLQPLQMDPGVMEQQEQTLALLRRALTDYADGLATPDPADGDLLETVDALRRVLELVYGQRITFKGENREKSGTQVVAEVEAADVEGYVAGVRTRGLADNANVHAKVRVQDVKPGGEVVGVDDIGGPGRPDE